MTGGAGLIEARNHVVTIFGIRPLMAGRAFHLPVDGVYLVIELAPGIGTLGNLR